MTEMKKKSPRQAPAPGGVPNGYAWTPTADRIASANVTRFMKAHAIATVDELVRRSTTDTDWFWAAALEDLGVRWQRPWTTLKDESKGFPWTRWFIDGRLNIVDNCIDRHLPARGDHVAVVGVQDDGHTRRWTYRELHDEVSRLAVALKECGVRRAADSRCGALR